MRQGKDDALEIRLHERLLALIEHDVGDPMNTYDDEDSLTDDVGFSASRLEDFSAEINHDFKYYGVKFVPNEMSDYDIIGDLAKEIIVRATANQAKKKASQVSRQRRENEK